MLYIHIYIYSVAESLVLARIPKLALFISRHARYTAGSSARDTPAASSLYGERESARARKRRISSANVEMRDVRELVFACGVYVCVCGKRRGFLLFLSEAEPIRFDGRGFFFAAD